MFSFHTFALFALATPLALASPQSNPALRVLERQVAPACNRDNLYRCFMASPAVASPYCNTGVAPATITASATITPTSTILSTTFMTVTATTQLDATETAIETVTTTDFTTVTNIITETSATSTTFTTNSALLKRAESSPACLTKEGTKSTSYPASRITSACACLAYRSTVTTTPTASAILVTSTITAMPTFTVTVTSTMTVSVKSTVSVSGTVTTSTTTTIGAVATNIVGFSRVWGPQTENVCDYPDNNQGMAVFGDYLKDYEKGKRFCANRCFYSGDLCNFFYFIVYSKDQGYCRYSATPFQGSALKCNVPKFLYAVGYDKTTKTS